MCLKPTWPNQSTFALNVSLFFSFEHILFIGNKLTCLSRFKNLTLFGTLPFFYLRIVKVNIDFLNKCISKKTIIVDIV